MSKDKIFDYPTTEIMVTKPSLKWRRDPPDVIPLWIASPDYPIAPEIKQVLIKAVESEDLYYNSDLVAREAMAEKINRVNRIEVTSDDVMIIQGVDPSIWLALRHACKPGDEVVVTDPMYAPFNRVMGVAETKPVIWNLDMEDGYMFDSEKLKELIGPRTKLINVCNPHNPASRVMTKEELKAIADIAVDHNINVMVDELWEDIVYNGRKHTSLASLNPEIEALTITSWGFSKTFGVAGLQLGYFCTTNKETMTVVKKHARDIQRGSSTLAKAVAPTMLDNTLDWWRKGIMKYLNKIRALCEKRFSEIPGVTMPKLEGTYVPFPKFDYGMNSKELQSYLREEGKIGLSAGDSFGANGEGHLRLCIATSETIMTEVFDRMEKALNKLG
jgi:aspartate/methionine/tyrosine aminotransferase